MLSRSPFVCVCGRSVWLVFVFDGAWPPHGPLSKTLLTNTPLSQNAQWLCQPGAPGSGKRRSTMGTQGTSSASPTYTTSVICSLTSGYVSVRLGLGVPLHGPRFKQNAPDFYAFKLKCAVALPTRRSWYNGPPVVVSFGGQSSVRVFRASRP